MMKNNLRNTFSTKCLVLLTALHATAAFACMPPPYPPPLSGVPDSEKNLPIVLSERNANQTGPNNGGPSCPTFSFAGYANLKSISDADWAEKVGGATVVQVQYPAWLAANVYLGGELVSYSGKAYKAKWWTQNEQPGNAGSVWEEQSTTVGGIEVWNSAKAYSAETQVIYSASVYRAKWWSQGEIPSDNAFGAWAYVGPAPQVNEVPVTSRPAPFSARIDTSTSPWRATLQAGFESGSYEFANRVEIRQNGTVVAIAPVTTLPSSCPPPMGDWVCKLRYTQTASVSFLPLDNKYLSVWLCTSKGVCRPSTRLRVPLEIYYPW